jgi:asparagine synthase (glutamine-hydrolysing)
MCGIAGYYSIGQSFSCPDLKKMTDCLQHRGPDADGFFSDNIAGLGHRRLSIIDLSNAANQPMTSHDERYKIIFNGEIFNYQDIAKELKKEWRTHSDTEVMLEAFVEWGPDAVQKFNGMFAIAIYDIKLQMLYLFRDRLGVKPIYYYRQENNIVFASEIKALMQLDLIRKNVTVNKTAISEFLYLGYIPQPHTIYNEIYKFPAGSYLKVSADEFTFQYYWKPEDHIEVTTINNYADAKKTLQELMTSSIKYRMISDVPFGTFLSGGIDSSLVTATAQSISTEPVKTFSIGFKESKFNESEYARKVANHLKTDHHEFIVTENEALELIDKMTDAYDEPFADSSSIPTMLVSKLARQYVTMTLSGDGGDELFLGYGMYNWASGLNNPFVRMFHQSIASAFSLLSDRYKRAAEVFRYDSPLELKSHIFSQEQYFFTKREIHDLLKNSTDGDFHLEEQTPGLKRKLSIKEEQALFDIKFYLKDDLLVKVDKASMQYSLETRTPFLDYRVVEFALNLNENLKIHNGTAKYLLKEVLYDYLPAELFKRPKWGFGIPLKNWLRKDLHYLIDKYLSREMIEQNGILNYNVVQKYTMEFESGTDYFYNRVWNLILLNIWMNKNS